MIDPIFGDAAARTRRNRIILASVLALVVGLTAVQVLIQQLRFPSPIASNILIFALVNINIVLLLLLVLLVFRSLFKVYLERRENILGSKFRVKLAIAFVSLALLPAALLFLVASNLITTSVDSWFNIQVEESLDKALEVAHAYSRASQDATLSQARQLASRLAEAMGADGSLGALRRMGGEKVREYGLDGVQIFNRQRVELAQWRGQKMPEAAMLAPASRLIRQVLDGEPFVAVQRISEGDLIRALAPVSRPGRPKEVLGAVVVTSLVPDDLLSKAEEIDTGIKEYQQLRMLKNPIKGVYLMLFLMVTLVIIFAAIWVGVYLARGITVPIQELAEGTRKVAAGDLSYKVQVKADDEIGILVDSFNQMTEDLSRSKVELTQAYQELQSSNVELDRRRDYMETVLETIAAGVLSLDADGRVNTVNRTAARMLGRQAEEILHHPYSEVFGGVALGQLRVLVSRLVEKGMETVDQQITLAVNGRPATLKVTVSGLRGPGVDPRGLVVVLDDISEVVRAQQAMAWREVARRIAHEIKNPLTPIQLSTQRLRKKFAERAPDVALVLDECTRTIIQEVEGLRNLVDEFSRYARMPSLRPRPGDLHAVVGQVAQLYAGMQHGITLRIDLDPEVPPLNLDPDHMKRALINLVDNAVAALADEEGEIAISTRYLPASGQVMLEVADTGPGFPPEDRDRVFLPYYSTKRSSGGLGLAIVQRIILEHGGQIRIEENRPRGARLVIELPVLAPVAA
ncbi:MAG TPA: ATP-binding protein [Candidatus Methylomirabilis sp.]|nr:ATP-binding protein [Candidatus Methylomirabilis sp.]HSC70258.1 ATP-binding protein [Candidatus Methylomirabilis sp.]